MRAAILVPWAIPVVVATKIWEWMLNDQFGVLNQMLIALGLVDHGIAWTASGTLIMGVVIFIDVWMTTPFMVLLILAGLQMIPGEIMEAAEVDGIPAWRTYLFIALPMMKGAVITAVILQAVGVIRVFDLVIAMTGGGPGYSTDLPAKFVVDHLFDRANIGRASAAAVLMLLTVIALLVLSSVATRLRKHSQSDQGAKPEQGNKS